MRPMALKALALAVAAAAWAATAPDAAALPAGEATAAQRMSFDVFYGTQHPGASYQASFARDADGTLVAAADGPAVRGAWKLCTAERRSYRQAAAPASARWQAAGPPHKLVWLDGAGDCGTDAAKVALTTPLGERDIVTVLEREADVVRHARLLLAGNTRCASQRAHAFVLTAIGPAAEAARPGERMLRLSYRSDRGGTAHITIRKRARQLDAWNVHC